MSDKLLIEIVRLWPMFYDPADPKYKDSACQKEVWQNIASALKERGSVVKARWKKLRDSYRKACQTLSEHEYSEQLTFLDTTFFCLPVESDSSDNSEEEEDQPDADAEDQVESPRDEQVVSSRPESDSDDDLIKPLTNVQCPHVILHPVDGFLTAIAPTLESIVTSCDLDFVKSRISEIVDKYADEMNSNPEAPQIITSKSLKMLKDVSHAQDFLIDLAPKLTALSSSYFSLAKFEIFSELHEYEKKILNRKRNGEHFASSDLFD